MDLIQKELDSVAHEWNVHRIRPSSKSPGSVPDMLYKSNVCNKAFMSEIIDYSMLLGTKSYKCSVDSESLASAKEYSMEKSCPVLKEFEDLAVTILKEDKIII